MDTQAHVSNEKNLGWLGYIGDYTTQLYRDYFIIHYKDPYSPSRIQWKVGRFFFRGSCVASCRKIVDPWDLVRLFSSRAIRAGSRCRGPGEFPWKKEVTRW